MCGIAGIINFSQDSISRKDIEKMVRIIKYRGPDDEGYFLDNNIGLGHCRLSIIDLSEAGHQPMTLRQAQCKSNKDRNFWIVYNGEVYNYLELREELKRYGHIFESNTDTEVILHAYEEWGTDCLNKFNGMWAFAIWDKNKRELFCSRDRFGIKPFYYFFDGKRFAFASEIKSLLELGIQREPNKVLIYDFLRFGISDHTNETFFQNIKKLPAASWMKVEKDGKVVIKKYWDFEVSDEIGDEGEKKKYAEAFLELFTDSVRLRLRSDVPVGSCLSGGLDSSTVVCVVNKLFKKEKIPNIGERQKTFSSCFEDKRFDEREYIDEIIKNTGAERNYIFPKAEELIQELDDLLWHQEEPFSSTSIYAQWKVLKTAKNKVKVLLDGQGGDENLCGYRKFYIFYLKKLLESKKYFSFFDESIRFFASPSILKTLNIKSGSRYFKLGRKLLKLEDLFNSQFLKEFQERNLNFGYQRNLGKRIKEDITTWSLPVLLRYEDKNSAAHSLETRLPFLDYRLVEKMASFPLVQKMKMGWTKVVLRNAMTGILPEKIRMRKSKLGFSVPETIWFKKRLNEEMKAVLRNPVFISNYADEKKLFTKFEKFLSGRSILGPEIFFRFYILELWGKKFIINYDHQK
jgi:asparagine synthase (glutamine-hydrolysing)